MLLLFAREVCCRRLSQVRCNCLNGVCQLIGISVLTVRRCGVINC